MKKAANANRETQMSGRGFFFADWWGDNARQNARRKRCNSDIQYPKNRSIIKIISPQHTGLGLKSG